MVYPNYSCVTASTPGSFEFPSHISITMLRLVVSAVRRVAPAASSQLRSLRAVSKGSSYRVMSAAAAPIPARTSAIEALRRAHAVCFDVDSTVITVEAIDEFAAYSGKKEAVAALTARAMGGAMKFEDALAARLDIIAPTADMLAGFLAAHPFAFTPGLREFVALLQARGTDVFLVSGGFTQMINPVADALGIPRERVFANTIVFDA